MIVTNEQVVSVTSKSGVTVWQFNPSDYTSMEWTRENRDVSSCTLDIPPIHNNDRLPDIIPWLHDLNVYDEHNRLLWRGPVQKLTANRTQLTIKAKDPAALMTRTRTPFTKKWQAVDPNQPANEMWRSLISQHGLQMTPILTTDPYGNPISFATTADAEMMDKPMDQLVQLGLYWTVASGIVILGPASSKPIVTLGETDFLGDGIQLVRDGAQTVNDVLVRGPDNLARGRIDLHGLNLQDIVNLDSMFAVSNVEKALQTHLRYVSQIRDAIDLDGDTQLHPEAPVSIDELIPSMQVVIDAFGLRFLMEIDKVTVNADTAGTSVKVAFESLPVTRLPELMVDASGTGKKPLSSRGRQASV